jgi:hypothetical protein
MSGQDNGPCPGLSVQHIQQRDQIIAHITPGAAAFWIGRQGRATMAALINRKNAKFGRQWR